VTAEVTTLASRPPSPRATGPSNDVVELDRTPTALPTTCRLMDGYSLEVLLGGPGRTRAWAVRSVLTALGRETGVTGWRTGR
jgi:hypothetical protein